MGEGISDSRIPILYKALGELNEMQSLKRVKDNSIGLGMSSSRIIAQYLGGDLSIIPQRHRLNDYSTQVEITIPVEIQVLEADSDDEPQNLLVNSHDFDHNNMQFKGPIVRGPSN